MNVNRLEQSVCGLLTDEFQSTIARTDNIRLNAIKKRRAVSVRIE